MTNASNVTSETETHGRDATYQLERIYGGAPPYAVLVLSTQTTATIHAHINTILFPPHRYLFQQMTADSNLPNPVMARYWAIH